MADRKQAFKMLLGVMPAWGRLNPLAQRVDELDSAFQRRIASRLEHVRMTFTARMVLLERIRPVALLERHRMKLELFEQRIGGERTFVERERVDERLQRRARLAACAHEVHLR